MNSNETRYLDLAEEVIYHGEEAPSRAGPVRRMFNRNLSLDLSKRKIPMLTVRKLAWSSIVEELLWMLSGSVNSGDLRRRGVNIWNANTSRQFLDDNGFAHYRVGETGPAYGHQWRRFGAEYDDGGDKNAGWDQMEYLLHCLRDKTRRTENRRMIVTAWNPLDVLKTPLPPCHILLQAHVSRNKHLILSVFQRSGDMGLGIPYNMASYALLAHILADMSGLEATELHFTIGDCHVYENHVETLKRILEREPKGNTHLAPCGEELTTFQQHFKADSFKLLDYEAHDSVHLKMAV